ncbi:MAG: chemotaxis protein CheA [Negativicutes bacterium]|nr:chemotaxis protein CheA [Negativicutes bacterium]
MASDINREPMLEMFLFETNQLIEQLEEIIIRCEKVKRLEPNDVNEIFRIMHTIKGSAAMMMFNQISLQAHAIEDLFFFIREKKDAKFDFNELSDLVLSGIDFVKAEINKIENGDEANGLADNLIAKIKEFLEQLKTVNDGEVVTENTREEKTPKYYISRYETIVEKPETKYQVQLFFDDDCQMENIRAYTVVHNLEEVTSEIHYLPADILDNNDSAGLIKADGFLICFSSDKNQEEIETILNQTMFMRQLEINVVEEYPCEIKAMIKPKNIVLCDEEDDWEPKQPATAVGLPDCISGEEVATGPAKQQSIISVNVVKLDMLMDLVGEIVISEAMVTRNPDLAGLNLDSFSKAARQLRKLTTELQDIVMSIRMVPIAMAFQKMNRIVRDMSRRLEKEVELEIIGETTEVDKNIIDQLSDPLMHLIRNAMDHGLETKEGRLQAGKTKKGKVTLEARNVGGDVWISVKDDGKGLDRDKLLAKAKEQGLVTKPDNELSDKEIFSFILMPGFSTKDKVTEFSGRGVGMDVVRKNIEKVGGSITIESILGQGTEILIKIPLTLAIIDGMEIGVGKSKYTIPTTSIRESFKLSQEHVIADSDGNEMIMVRGQCYPVIRVHKLFKIQTDITAIGEGIIVMIESEAKSACLFADKLLGEQQVVVKALPTYMKRVQGIAGCTILGDGNISLILDVDGIMENKM